MSIRTLLSYFGLGSRNPKPRVTVEVNPAPVDRWQDRVAAIQLPLDERIPIIEAHQTKSPRTFDDKGLVKKAVEASGLSKARDEDVAFFVSALKSGNLNGRDIRKAGRPLSKEEKAALGIKFRGILTHEFVETLNDEGLADPENAAWLISTHAARLVSSAGDLSRQLGAGIDLVRFRFGGMAAGHCDYSKKMDGKTVPVSEAPLLPADNCKHPDQCGCRWQAHIDLFDL